MSKEQELPRNVVLFMGPSACGKTRAIHTLHEEYGDVLQLPVISDGRTLLSRVHEDDFDGGEFHTHPWVEDNTEGHSHGEDDPVTPFTVTDSELVHRMQSDFFHALPYVQSNGVVPAELSFGKNTNPEDVSAYGVDISATSIAERLASGELPSDGLSRIHTAVHIQTKQEERTAFNERRLETPPTKEEINMGLASWGLDEPAMNIFGIDDGDVLHPIFEDAGIQVMTVENNGTDEFFQELTKKIEPVFDDILG